MGLHQFGLSQHTSASRKVLKSHANQHQVIVGGRYAPSLANTATLTVPDSVSLPDTLTMARGYHAHLRVVLVTLFLSDHPTALAMKWLNTEIVDSYMELEEYNPRDRGLKARLP